jgi:parvulin-like peptidyl-prolyl isomerase
MKIDGHQIDPQELTNEFHRLMQSQADRPDDLKVSEDEVRELAREHVVSKWLIVREARNRVSEVTADEVKRRAKQLQKQYGPQFDPESHREDIEDDIRVDKLVQEINTSVPKVSEEEARAEFDSDPSQYAEPARVHVSHIVRHTFGGADPGKSLQQIMEAQRQLKQGAPWEAVARQFSDQHGQAGDLGTFARGAMVDKFENVVFRMNPGEISDVFQTEFGYHIALVHETFPQRERSFQEARADVVRSIRERREREAFDRFVESLREAATIEREDHAPESGSDE